jgi:hypothetical protein
MAKDPKNPTSTCLFGTAALLGAIACFLLPMFMAPEDGYH